MCMYGSTSSTFINTFIYFYHILIQTTTAATEGADQLYLIIYIDETVCNSAIMIFKIKHMTNKFYLVLGNMMDCDRIKIAGATEQLKVEWEKELHTWGGGKGREGKRERESKQVN